MSEDGRPAPLVYVVVLNWNGWRDTVACLSSLKNIDYPNFEILVVDNGSQDDSEAKIRELHPDVTLLQTGENLGFAGGNNTGISLALERGADYVWLLNNDTLVYPRALSEMVRRIEAEPELGLVGSVLYHMDDEERIQVYGGGRVRLWVGVCRPLTVPVPDEKLDYVIGASMLIKREVLKLVGLLDDNYFMSWEDCEYGFRVREAGWKLAVAAGSKILHKETAALGKKTPITEFHFNASAVRFFGERCPSLTPTLVGVGGRLAKRLARGDWKRARAVLRGAVAGWRRR